MIELEPPPQQTQHDQREAEKCGGSDTEDYRETEHKPYCDKPDHAERSEYHQPNHHDHKQS